MLKARVAEGLTFRNPLQGADARADGSGEGRGCCDLPDRGAPAGEDENPGICVCEFEDHFGMGQSKVSYHVRKLKEAGLLREEKRGKWSFYSFDREAVGALIHETSEHLGALTEPETKV